MHPSTGQIPITILNGFLGAGKTTLLQSLLVQSRKMSDIQVGVIVNEMSELDIDGAVLDTNEIFSMDDPKFASISAGSISSTQGLQQFQQAIEKLSRAAATHIILETSGSTHPWPLLQAIEQHKAIRLHGFLSVVDTVTLAENFDLGRTILPTASRNLDCGRRGIENLLAEQIMFANRILLSKMDRVPEQTLRSVGEAIHPINRGADIMAMQWGNVRLSDILAMPPYNHAHVAQLGAELAEWDQQHGYRSMDNADDYKIDSIVISDPRPMHPTRFWDTYNQYLGTTIYRSKGFFWLPSRDRLQLLWNQTGGSVGLGILNYWKIAALEDERLTLLPEERAEMQKRLAGLSPDFGDRHCHLTVIGDRAGLEPFANAVRACLCTQEEISAWKAGAIFDDPWPDATPINPVL